MFAYDDDNDVVVEMVFNSPDWLLIPHIGHDDLELPIFLSPHPSARIIGIDHMVRMVLGMEGWNSGLCACYIPSPSSQILKDKVGSGTEETGRWTVG